MRKKIFITLGLLFLILISFFCQISTKQNENKHGNFRVIAYCMNERGNIEKFEIDKLTHLIFCFTVLQGNKISFRDSADEDRLKRFIALKAKYPKLKVLVGFGGWGYCETCSDVFASSNGRKEFVTSVCDLLKKYNADGIDIDWESPVIGGYKNHKASKEDKENFTSLIIDLRNALPAKSEICFDANSFKTYIDLSIDWQKVMPLVDYVNLMTYSLPSNSKGHTGHHAALYSSRFQNESANIGIHRLDSIGVPMNKIIIGAGFYAEVSENVDSINNGLGRPGTFKKNADYKDVFTTFKENDGYVYHWDSIAQAPFIYNKQLKTFVTYDNIKSVSLKTQYAIENNLGGIMFWNLRYDTYKEGLFDAIDKQIKTNKDEKPHIAFSFDGGSTNNILTYENEDWNSMIRKQLKENRVQAILFVAGKAVDSEKGKQLLQRWNDDGHLIANHTYSHWDLNDSLIPCKTYIADIQKCDLLISKYKNYRKLFRSPYLNGGNTISKRDSLSDFLHQNDYKAGWVTIDNAEWYINMRLIQLLKQNPKADISGYKDYYINNMFDMANYYNKLSIQNNHRQIKHTILLHFNLTSALFLNDLIKKFRNEGWIIDNYSEAIKDSVYSEHPIAMPAEHSLIWMQEMQRVGSVPRYNGEESNYLKVEMDKLGL
jgi:chitinase